MKPIYTILIAVIVGAAGFFGGMQYQKSMSFSQFGSGMNRFSSGQGSQGRFFMGGNRNGGSRVIGNVLSMDSNSMTVKTPDGSTRIVILAGSTTYSKATTGTVSDVKTGENVSVFGTINSDGSVTAQNIQIGGQFMQRNGGTPPEISPSGSPQP